MSSPLNYTANKKSFNADIYYNDIYLISKNSTLYAPFDILP